MQDRDKVRTNSQQIKAKYNNAPKSVVLIDSSGKTGCKMSNKPSDSEDGGDNLYSDVNNAFTLENELSKPDRSETASHVEAEKEKLGTGMKCLIDVTSAVKMSPSITDENMIDSETSIAGGVGRSGGRDKEEFNKCEAASRVRKSLENISIPSWYTKYSENDKINKSQKWTRHKTEVSFSYIEVNIKTINNKQ